MLAQWTAKGKGQQCSPSVMGHFLPVFTARLSRAHNAHTAPYSQGILKIYVLFRKYTVKDLGVKEHDYATSSQIV